MMSLLFTRSSYDTSTFFLRLPNHRIFLVVAGHFAVSLVYHNLQLNVVDLPVQLLMQPKLVHCGTKGDGLLTPSIPARSASHLHSVAVLDALHEVISRIICFFIFLLVRSK